MSSSAAPTCARCGGPTINRLVVDGLHDFPNHCIEFHTEQIAGLRSTFADFYEDALVEANKKIAGLYSRLASLAGAFTRTEKVADAAHAAGVWAEDQVYKLREKDKELYAVHLTGLAERVSALEAACGHWGIKIPPSASSRAETPCFCNNTRCSSPHPSRAEAAPEPRCAWMNKMGYCGRPQRASCHGDDFGPADYQDSKFHRFVPPAAGEADETVHYHGSGLEEWRCVGVCSYPASRSGQISDLASPDRADEKDAKQTSYRAEREQTKPEPTPTEPTPHRRSCPGGHYGPCEPLIPERGAAEQRRTITLHRWPHRAERLSECDTDGGPSNCNGMEHVTVVEQRPGERLVDANAGERVHEFNERPNEWEKCEAGCNVNESHGYRHALLLPDEPARTEGGTK